MVKVIMFNGPRQVGKDYLASHVAELSASAKTIRMTDYLKEASIRSALSFDRISEHFGGMWRALKHCEAHKDEPQDAFNGRTPREVFIDYGNYARETFGDDYFARQWASRADRHRGFGRILVPDVRFQPEVDAAVGKFGAANVFLVRVRRSDYDWTGDIGSYLTHSVSADFYNDSPTSRADIDILIRDMHF